MKAHQRLQKVLTALATDQKEIAKKIGKHEVSVSRMVNGVMDPSFDTLVALKKSYPMININYLVSGEGPMFMSVSDLNYANEDQAGYGSPAAKTTKTHKAFWKEWGSTPRMPILLIGFTNADGFNVHLSYFRKTNISQQNEKTKLSSFFITYKCVL